MPERIQLSRTKGWRKPEGAVVVARPSKWGNPFELTTFPRRLAIALYREMVQGGWNPYLLRAYSDVEYLTAVDGRQKWLSRLNWHHPLEAVRYELAGHDLACWCPLDQPCHADVLLELANAPSGEEGDRDE